VVPGDEEGAEEVRLVAASAWVVVMVAIRSRWRARAQLEAAGAATQSDSIPTAWWRCVAWFVRETRGAEGVK
jgi:hypothetical protein